MALPPSSQPEGEDYPANGRPSQDLDTTGRAHVGSLLNESSSPQTDCKLRAELKRHYHGLREAIFGQDMKYYWRSEGYMLKLVDKKPEIAMDRGLKQLCNKSTMLYWALARHVSGVLYPKDVFHRLTVTPEINMLTPESPNSIRSGVRPYFMPRDCLRLHIQSRFRCHDNVPNIDFGRFFAHPFQITATGPQTISEIMETHAHICDRAASQLESIQSGDIESSPVEWRHWERYHLLPLCRAVVVVLDELLLSPPVCRIDGTISLDDEIQRRTAVLILTGYGHGLSNIISFDAIKSEFLPLARDDVCACDSARTIRVSLKTAVQFIAELQQREDTAFSSLKQDTVNTILEPNTYGVFAVDRADEYVDDVLNNPLEDESKQSEIKYARETIKMRERGEVSYEAEFDHWNSSWI